MCLYVLFPSSTSSTYIVLQPLGVCDLSSTCFFQIENPLIIKEVMNKNVCVFSSSTSSTNIALQPFRCVWSIFDNFDIALMSCINLSQHLQHQTICIDMRPLMYTQQIRWQWVRMGVNEWLPHYLIRSRSHCNSNFNSKLLVIRRNNPK